MMQYEAMLVVSDTENEVREAEEIAKLMGGGFFRLSNDRWLARDIDGNKLGRDYYSRYRGLGEEIDRVIRDRAYSLWQQRGGSEIDNWTEAENNTLI